MTTPRALLFTSAAVLALSAGASASGCGGHPSPVADRHASLGGENVALVGSVAIPASLVARVAGAQSIAPRHALDLLVADALAAQEAERLGRTSEPSLEWPITSVLARATTERVREDALAAGPPSDAEVAERTDAHWRDLARPETVHVIHAIVLRPKRPKPGDDDRARAIAADLLKAVAPATSAEDFESRANAVPHEGFQTKVERLPAFTIDGRTAEGPFTSMDPVFARAAFALAEPGSTSPVVETSRFGWHVIRLVERLPPREIPLEDRRAMLHDEILTLRGSNAIEAILKDQRATAKVEIEPDAEELMKSLRSAPAQ